MNDHELIKIVSKTSPWLAPIPSAYFVARSGIAHLALPLSVAITVAVIIEFLGLATVHTALWAYDWNAHKRKTDPSAPLGLAIALAGVYIVATWGLVVVLEVWPELSTYAPAIFPALAVVGALNLALISRQEMREDTVKQEKAERKEARQSVKQAPRHLDPKLDALLTFYQEHPGAGVTEAARALGVSRQTVYTYRAKLEADGRKHS